MTTISPPATFDAVQAAGLGFTHVFAAQQILLEVQDMLDVLPVVNLWGDVAGSGSDVIRVTNMGSVGYARRFATLASETSRPTPSNFTVGYDELTVALHALAMEETYSHQVLTRERQLTTEELVKFVPASWASTLRYKVCVEGSNLTDVIGAAADVWTVDDELDLVAHYTEALATGRVYSIRAPQQLTQLRDSVRNESAYKFESAFKETQKFRGLQQYGDAMGLGIEIAITDDVQQSGGAYQGFSFVEGAFGWGRASTGNVRPKQMEGAMYLPELGMFIKRSGADDDNSAGFTAYSWFGVGHIAASVKPSARIRSLV
jgi:hypothetical protein